jgi:peptidoglycan/xylan/chitin deacetylase (PgdA/CDA1 family)
MHRAHRAAGASIARLKRAGGGFERRSGLTILGWHRFGDMDDGLTVSVGDFGAQLDTLVEYQANVLGLNDAVQGLCSGSLPPRAVALTFDDGYTSVAEKAWPILKARGLPATLYVVPGYMLPGATFPWDEPRRETSLLTASDIRQLHTDGMDIGSHSMMHRWLPTRNKHDLWQDLCESKMILEDLLSSRVEGFAYPTGGWNRRVRRLVAKAEYTYAVTVDRGVNSVKRPRLQSLRRTIVPNSATDLRIVLDGGYDYIRFVESLRRHLFQRHKV